MTSLRKKSCPAKIQAMMEVFELMVVSEVEARREKRQEEILFSQPETRSETHRKVYFLSKENLRGYGWLAQQLGLKQSYVEKILSELRGVIESNNLEELRGNV